MQRRTLLKIALSSVAVAATPGWATESTSQVTLYKDPQCDCCRAYADYLRDNGFMVAAGGAARHHGNNVAWYAGRVAGYGRR